MTTDQKRYPYVVVWPGDRTKRRIDLSATVLSFQASLGNDGAPGLFSITVLPRASLDLRQTATDLQGADDLYRLLTSNGHNRVVSLGFDEPGGILLGLTSSVRRTSQLVGEAVARTITITGQTLGKALTVDSIFRGQIASSDPEAWKAAITDTLGAEHPTLVAIQTEYGPVLQDRPDGARVFEGQDVAYVIRWALSAVGSMQIPVLADVAGEELGRIGDIIKTDRSVTTWNAGRVFSSTPETYQGTILGFLYSLLDRDFYELWIDTVPVEGSFVPDVHLIVRPKPFDDPESAWLPVREQTGLTWDTLTTLVDRLPHHEIPLDRVMAVQLGTSDAECPSWYLVTSAHALGGNPVSLAEGWFYPALDLYNAAHHGLRSYEAHLRLIAGDVAAKIDEGDDLAAADRYVSIEIPLEVVEFRNRLVNWYRHNAFMEQGSITVIGSDRYRPGDPVYLPWQDAPLGEQLGMRYYCTSVSWSWSWGQPYTCSLQLTRGHNRGLLEEFRRRVLKWARPSAPLGIVFEGVKRVNP